MCSSPVRSARPAKGGFSFELPAVSAVCGSRVPGEKVAFPVCLGSAIQTEQHTWTDRSACVLKQALSDLNDRDRSSKTFSCLSTVKPPERGSASFVSHFLRLVHLAGCAPVRCRQQQQQQFQQCQHAGEELFCNGGAETDLASKMERRECEFQPTKGVMQTERVLQWASDGHRRALEMYGGTVEEIIRLALHVLPAQATGSELHVLMVIA